MLVKAYRTNKITTTSGSILDIVGAHVPKLGEKSVLAVSSKIVALCEGSVAPAGTDKDALVVAESDQYLPPQYSRYQITLSVKNHILIPNAGIDESNSADGYVLWPKHPQRSAEMIRHHLMARDKLTHLGVIITDSTTAPLRSGTSGISLASAGFEPVKSYIGQPDLFGRTMEISRASIAHGLAATAALVMGEGTEQTPLVVLSDVDFVSFTDHPASEPQISIEDDLFAPFLTAVKWRRGGTK